MANLATWGAALVAPADAPLTRAAMRGWSCEECDMREDCEEKKGSRRRQAGRGAVTDAC